MAQSIVTLGISGGGMADKVVSDFEVVNTGLGFINAGVGAQSIEFSK